MPEGMTDEQRKTTLDKLEAVKAELRRRNISGSSGAFTDSSPDSAELPPPLPPDKSTVQEIAEFAVPSAASMAGAAGGARLVAPLAEAAGPAAPLVLGAGAVAGATGLGALGQGTMDVARTAMGLPGKPDSVDEALSNMWSRGVEEGKGELLGRTVIGPAMSRILPYRKALTPQSEAMMTDHARRIRAAYEEIGGAPLVEDTRARWNPARWMSPAETELDDHAVVQRLTAAGYDPKVARKVALTGGLAPSEVENSTFSKLWGYISSSKVEPHTVLDLKYNVSRSKLAQVAGLEDIGAKFADMLPPEKVGDAVEMAVHGRFNELNMARTTGMNGVASKLPDGFTVDVSAAKRFRTPTGSYHPKGAPLNPDDIRPMTLIQGLDNKSSFTDVQNVRTSLGSMMHDERLSDTQKDAAKRAAKYLDRATKKSLPPELHDAFDLWSHADDEMNREAFNSHFIKGLLSNKGGLRAYAENKLIKPGDVGQFRKLERALSGTADGDKLIASVKGAINERVLNGASSADGVINPSRLVINLATESKGYGKHFLNAVMGPDYVQHYQQYAEVMNQVNHAAQRASSRMAPVKALGGAALVAGGIYDATQGTLGQQDVLTLAAAMYAPRAVSAILTSRQATKWLLKAANHVATGKNPMTASRLAGRALEYVGVTPEAALEGLGILPNERQDKMNQEIGALRSDPTRMAPGAL